MQQGKALEQKLTLFSGKTVVLRELKIKHQELAAMAAAPKANGNNSILTMLMQKELIKLLIVKVNDKSLKLIELEDLDNLFTFKEYTQLNHILNELVGEKEMGKYQIELVSSGGN